MSWPTRASKTPPRQQTSPSGSYPSRSIGRNGPTSMLSTCRRPRPSPARAGGRCRSSALPTAGRSMPARTFPPRNATACRLFGASCRHSEKHGRTTGPRCSNRRTLSATPCARRCAWPSRCKKKVPGRSCRCRVVRSPSTLTGCETSSSMVWPRDSIPSGVASARHRSSRVRRWSSCVSFARVATTPGPRQRSGWRYERWTRWPPEGSTTISLVASAATRPMPTGWSPTSKRCSPIRPCSPAPICMPGR